MHGIKEILVNPNHRTVKQLQPAHGFMLFAGIILVWLLTITFTGDEYNSRLEAGDSSAIGLFIQLPLTILAVVFILAIRLRWRDLKLHGIRLIDAGFAFLLAIAAFVISAGIMIGLSFLMMAISPKAFQENIEQLEVMENLVRPEFWIFARSLVFLALTPALIEELIYRGLIMESFMKWGPLWGILGSALLFGLSHGVPIKIPSLIVVGIILGWLKYRTGNLAVSMLMHFIYNSIVLWIGLWMQSLV